MPTLMEILQNAELGAQTRAEADAIFGDLVNVYQTQQAPIVTDFVQDDLGNYQRRDFHGEGEYRFSPAQLERAMRAKTGQSSIREGIFDYLLETTGNPSYATTGAVGADFAPVLGTAIGLEDAYYSGADIPEDVREGNYIGAANKGGQVALELGTALLGAIPAGKALGSLLDTVAPTAKADIAGLGRGILQADPSMVGEVFQRGGAPQSLSAGIPYEMIGSDIRKQLNEFPTAAEVANAKVQLPAGAKFSNMVGQRDTIIDDHYSRGILSDEMTSPVDASLSSLSGKTIMGLVGDPTGRKIVEQIGDLTLPTSVKSQAGAEFSDIDDFGWASAQEAMTAKFNEIERVDNPFMMFLNMGEQSGDFAKHTGRTVGQAVKSAMMSNSTPIVRDKIPSINEAIRKIGMTEVEKLYEADGVTPQLTAKGNPKTKSSTIYPFANFKSVEDPNYLAQYIEDLPTGSQRAAFIKGLDKKALQDAGFPNIGSIRVALANPDLIGRDWLSAGYRGFEPDVQSGLLATTPEIHDTYNTMIKKTGPSYTFSDTGRGIPANLLMVENSELQRAKGTGGGLIPTSADYKQYESSPAKTQQFMHDRAMEIVETFSDLEQRGGRRAALQYAQELLSGGRISSAMIKAARKANAPTWMIAAMTGAGTYGANNGDY